MIDPATELTATTRTLHMRKTCPDDRPHADSLSFAEADEIGYFGFCPACRRTPTGGGNVERDHYQWCEPCGIAWLIGQNLFSTWRDEDTREWEQNRLRLSGYVIARSYHHPGPNKWEAFWIWLRESWDARPWRRAKAPPGLPF